MQPNYGLMTMILTALCVATSCSQNSTTPENPTVSSPSVQKTSPSGSLVDTSKVEVVFSKSIDPTTLSLKSDPPATSEFVKWNIDFTVAEWKVSLTPGSTYKFTVDAKDTAGNLLNIPSNTWSFSTKPAAPANVANDALLTELGSTAGVADFFASSNETDIRAKLAQYGMKYTVLPPVKESDFDPLSLSTAAVSDCSPARFTEVESNAWFTIPGVNGTYFVDSQGRPQRAVLKAPPITRERRSAACQAEVGKIDFSTGYDGGHIIASQLGGWGKRLNMVPQNSNFNRGNWSQIENQLAKCSVLAANSLKYEVSLYYPTESTNTPGTFTVDINISGASVNETFENADSGGADGTAKRERIVTWLTTQGCGDVQSFDLKLTNGDQNAFDGDTGSPALEPINYVPPIDLSYTPFFTEDGAEVPSINSLYCQQQRTYTFNYRSLVNGRVFAKSKDFKIVGRPCRYDINGSASWSYIGRNENGDAIDLTLNFSYVLYPRESPGIKSIKVFRNGSATSVSWDVTTLTQDQTSGTGGGSKELVVPGIVYGTHDITMKAYDKSGKEYSLNMGGKTKNVYKIYITKAGEPCPVNADSCNTN
jgi:DNA/RNA non-specific endonuclease